MLKAALTLFFFCLITCLSSQNLRTILPNDYNPDSLRKIFGDKKHFIKEFELQSLIALTHYPELKNSKIVFKFSGKQSMAQTTISFFSIFKTSNKHFIIYINNQKATTGVALQNLSFNAQIGVIGHELAHISDFKRKGPLQMLWWGFAYLNKKHRRVAERNTDVATIQHDLGWQLYDFIDFVLNDPVATEKYKNLKRTNYLQPAEILSLMK